MILHADQSIRNITAQYAILVIFLILLSYHPRFKSRLHLWYAKPQILRYVLNHPSPQFHRSDDVTHHIAP
jgi:hypothetical protein